MSKGICFYLDSGANIHSRYSTFVTWDELGMTEEEWEELTEEEQTDIAKDYAWAQMDWGFYKSDTEERSR